ncbi:hypothetical protein HF325_006583 [Metschnikowia pulcherrima]|uniref:Repetitive proline-rich cell wall protein n=1 Tax=Metschnikowia pulcherrima TaxID=27326 RepID=A0A8H7L717_9ASCO|nr:hypothetical protein HF325_006583 [Metschnikowia pulcherrima]
MRFTSLALFAGVSLAAISAWSNATDVLVGLHLFDGDDLTSRYDSSHHLTSHHTDHRKPPHRRPPPHKGPHRRPPAHRKPPHHRTKKGYTTYCPHSTVLTITTCKKHVCGPTLISVSEPTSITLTEDCLVEETHTPDEHVTGPAPPVTKVVEYTVTDYATYCPKPTVLTYTKYIKHKRIPVAYTVTAPSTITITGTCILASTITSKSTATVNVAQHVAYGTVTKTVEETYTDYITYCPTPTVFTVTKLINKQRAVYDITVTEATTLTVYGTCVVASTITEEVNLDGREGSDCERDYSYRPTLLTVTKLVKELREASVITVTKATTITVPGTLVVATTITEAYKATKAAAYLHAFTETAYETTVTEYTTYCPTPTALTVTQLVNNVRAVAVITVTEATTISVPGTVVYLTTVTEKETATAAAAVVNAAAVTTTAYTVTEFTTYFPSATVYTVTQVVNEEQTVSVITVTEATTVSVPGTVVYASVAAVALAQTEYTVTEFTTYIPEATLYTVTQIVNEQQAVNVITVTEATTLAVPGTIVVSAAVTADAAAYATVAAVNAVAESVVASTVTEFSTYLPYATAFTYTQLVDNEETVSVISVTEATTLTVEGTVIVASTVTAPPAADVYDIATAGPTDTVILESTALPKSVAAQAVAAAYQAPEVSALPYSVSPAVTTIENGAARRVAGIVGVIGVVALLY